MTPSGLRIKPRPELMSILKKHLSKYEINILNEITDLKKLMSRDVEFKKTSGTNYYTLCKFHDEKSPSLCCVSHKNFYYCFGCGTSGNAYTWLRQRYKYSHYRPGAKALGELLSFNNISVKELKKLAKEKKLEKKKSSYITKKPRRSTTPIFKMKL